MRIYKFDRRIWIFIIAASIIIPGFYQIRGLITGENFPPLVIITGVAFTFVVTLAISLVNYTIISKILDRKLPWSNDKKVIALRVVVEVIVTSFTAALIISLIILVAENFLDNLHPGKSREVIYFENITVAVIVNLIVMSIIEANYLFTMWRDSLLKTERLERENIESQFNALKNQVNPHFLFNSMNVLNSLIGTDPEKAREFVGEFSRIFRYVFEVGDEMVVALDKEISFIRSYISLQQKRYGNCLRSEIRIDAGKFHYFLPVLSLQILVENAIKHNEISEEKPLVIELFDQDDWLVIQNNLQPRDEDEHSTGIGLRNLRERYGVLCDREPEFIASNDRYTARIPLITDDNS